MGRTAPQVAALAALAAALLLLHGASASASDSQRIELLRMLANSPWLEVASHRQRQPPSQPNLDQNLPPEPDMMELDDSNSVEDITENSEKRSAVATALNAGRRRRQPTPALGVLNDVGSFFDSLRDNLETLAALSPQQRATLMQEPSVLRARQSASANRIGGGGIRRVFPARVTGNIRSYNRRSFVEAEGYPGANHHDPALLWTGLGR